MNATVKSNGDYLRSPIRFGGGHSPRRRRMGKSNGKVEWGTTVQVEWEQLDRSTVPDFKLGGGKYSQNSPNCFLTMSNSNETWVISASVAEAEITKSHFVILRRSPSPHVCFGSGGKFEFVALGFDSAHRGRKKGAMVCARLGRALARRIGAGEARRNKYETRR